MPHPVKEFLNDLRLALFYVSLLGSCFAAAILVSPLFLAGSSTSHWLTIKTDNDYALLRLDKSNYKLVIAELEKRTGIKVQDVGENK